VKTSLRILRAVKRDAFFCCRLLAVWRNISENARRSKAHEENNPATAPFQHNHLIEMQGAPPILRGNPPAGREALPSGSPEPGGATVEISPKRTAAAALYGELGRKPLQFRRKDPHISGTRRVSARRERTTGLGYV